MQRIDYSAIGECIAHRGQACNSTQGKVLAELDIAVQRRKRYAASEHNLSAEDRSILFASVYEAHKGSVEIVTIVATTRKLYVKLGVPIHTPDQLALARTHRGSPPALVLCDYGFVTDNQRLRLLTRLADPHSVLFAA